MSWNAQENPVVQIWLDLMNFSNRLSGTYREVWFRERPHVHAPKSRPSPSRVTKYALVTWKASTVSRQKVSCDSTRFTKP